MRRREGWNSAGHRALARSIAALAAACLSLAVAGCGEEAPEPEEVARPVKIFEVRGSGATVTREYPGRIRAIQQADMAFEVPGKIIEFRFKEGEQVQEGEVLARLDDRDFQARLDSARAQAENARVNFERAQKLFEEGALAALERDRRRTVYDTAEANLREASKAVEDTALRAPFAGVMARKLVEDFENVQAKQVVLILQDESHLEIRINVPERDMTGGRAQKLDPDEITRRIQPRVVATSIPDREFPARVKQLAMIADPTTRTFEATFVIERPADVSVLPGMTAKVIISVPAEAAGRSGMRIPASATVSDEQGNAVVWVLDPSSMTVRPVAVELGELSGSEVTIRGGLSDGDQIAISGVHQLREGMTVRRFEP
jgi:RND family efflux transporter MFP subunit